MKSRLSAPLGMALLAAVSLARDAPKHENQATGGAPQPKTQAQKPAAAASNGAAVKPQAKEEKRGLSEREKRGYALGVQLGSDVVKQGLEVNPHLLVKGLMDALTGGKLLMTVEDINATVTAIRNEKREKIAQAIKELAKENKRDGEAFLAANKAKGGVVSLANGLQYRILNAGVGKKPTLEDKVVIHYWGTRLNGKEIDNSHKRNEASTFAVKETIKGWREALQRMPVGSKWQLFIPPQLAYGEQGVRGKIGPNETLMFELELVAIQDKQPTQTAQQSP